MELTKVTALMKATALEVAILAGHLVLYPSGIVAERLAAAPAPEKTPARTRSTTSGEGPDPADEEAPDTAPTSIARGDGSRPVVLLHGLVDNRSVFVLLRRSLTRNGRDCVESLNYSPLTCDLRAAAELLGRRVDEIRARTGHAEVDVVGHSLGGLIARYYVQRLGGDSRVRTLVMLGTPHAGTTVAPLADAHPLVRQMRPGSEVLRELAGPAPGCRTRFVSFWSDLDQMMVPVETARLDHPDLVVHNVRVSGIGHLALPVHPTVAAGVREALDAGGPVASGAREEGHGSTSVA
ncbi:esterase/lipase family protein [Streptomyces sp. NPDC090298]|uniref:esterase/lipase family protein n=1 Tax=Streptomyces sp. NPDC090298 TaxID=3365959 RepID=UPI003805A955